MNLLITGAWGEAASYIPVLEDAGHHVKFLQWEEDPLPCEPEWAEGIIGRRLFTWHSIEQFSNLRYIQLTCAGVDHIPVEYIREHEIELHNARGVYSIPMAEYAVSGVLQLYKRTREFTRNQERHRWEKIRGIPELYGKTVCIVGCGSVGQECAKRFHAFGCRVIGVRKRAQKETEADHSATGSVSIGPSVQGWFHMIRSVYDLVNILPETDILVLAVPLTESTKYLIDDAALHKLKQSTVIVNLSRGPVIHTGALVEALRERTIGGVVLDVFEEEPLPEGNPLWDMNQAILTPHNSYVGEGNGRRLVEIILRNLSGV